MSFPSDVFKEYNMARIERNRLPARYLDFSSSGKRYNILAALRIMPILNFPLW
jgi:hypothetical protein